MMHSFTRWACCGAAFALLLGVPADAGAGKADKPPGKPGGDEPKTQACVLSGDATGQGQVGIDAKSYGPLTMTIGEGTSLANVFSLLGVDASYSGLGRVLKRDGRLDFHFNLTASVCRPLEWGDEPGPGLDPDVCQYHLYLDNGVYDRKADEVEFQSPVSLAHLYDYRAEPGSILIGSGSATLWIDF